MKQEKLQENEMQLLWFKILMGLLVKVLNLDKRIIF